MEDKKTSQQYGKEIESLIRIREQAKLDLVKSRMKLIELGAKTVHNGSVSYLPGLDLDKFNHCNNQEFTWEAQYVDGTVVKQFEGSKQYHYGHIDQTKLKFFRWVSNFDYPTSNEERRVIVELNFETGHFGFTNGFVSQETRGAVINGYTHGFVPKLILKAIKRTSTSHSFPDGNVDEITYYNRYLIGYEAHQDSLENGKVVLCIEPNGEVHLWDE